MKIHLHSELQSPVLEPYRVLADFGLETSSSQQKVQEIDIEASFQIKDQSILTAIREPNRRILLDFFCLPQPVDFEPVSSLADIEQKAKNLVLKTPNQTMAIHRLACIYHQAIWAAKKSQSYELIFSNLKQAIPCWVMVLQDTDYIRRWREARYYTYRGVSGSQFDLYITNDLISQLSKEINFDLTKTLQAEEVVTFSRLRSRKSLFAFDKEQFEQGILGKVGGVENSNKISISAGGLGIEFLKLKQSLLAKAKRLVTLHIDKKTSYLAGIKEGATLEEQLRFDDVQRFKFAFFDFGNVYFYLVHGIPWQALAELLQVVNYDRLDQIDDLDLLARSLLYVNIPEGKTIFENDFWYLVATIFVQVVKQELNKTIPDMGTLRQSLERIRMHIDPLEKKEMILAEILAAFLARSETIEDPTGAIQVSMEKALRLLKLYQTVLNLPDDNKLNTSIARLAGNLGAYYANQEKFRKSKSYYQLFLKNTTPDKNKIEEAVLVYEKVIQDTKWAHEKLALYQELLVLLDANSNFLATESSLQEMVSILAYKQELLERKMKKII